MNRVVVVTGGAKGIGKCFYEEFLYAQKVGVAAPFYLAKLLKDHFAAGASIINISSSSHRHGCGADADRLRGRLAAVERTVCRDDDGCRTAAHSGSRCVL